MTDSNFPNLPDNVHIGPAVLGLFDTVNDWLVNVGAYEDIVVSKTIEKAFLRATISGASHKIDGKEITEDWQIVGRASEMYDPNTQYLFFKNCGTPAMEDCGIGTEDELIQVFDGITTILRRNNGFYGIGALPAPAAVAGVAAGTGGTIPASTYTFVVTGVYGTTEGDYEESAGVIVAATQEVTLTITPPAGGAVPDFYRVYIYDSGGGETRVADADLILETYQVVNHFLSWTRGGTAYPGDQTSSFTVTSQDGLTEYDAGVDFTIDATCARFLIIDGGGITGGEWVHLEYTFYKNPRSVISIGPSDRNPKKVYPVIYSFKDDDQDTPHAKGLEFHFTNVEASSGFELNMSQMDYSTGFNFEWDALIDPATLNYGTAYSYNRHFEEYVLMDWRDLTQFTNATNCIVVPT